MRLSLRFILPLAFVISLIAYGVMPLVDSLTLRWFVRDLDMRAELIANTMNESLVPLLESESRGKIRSLFDRAIEDERLDALAFCSPDGKIEYKTSTFPKEVSCDHPAYAEKKTETTSVMDLKGGPLHVAYVRISDAA